MAGNEAPQVYMNNPKLKSAGVEVEFSAHHVEELRKCYEDPIHFIKNYVYITNIDKGVIKFSLYDFQEEIVRLELKNRKVIMVLPRQAGKSTTTGAAVLHYVLFNESKTVAILANKAATAREILGRVKDMYENLPHWMQVGVKEWNKGSIVLGNGCKVIAAATSGSAIRGQSVAWLVLDEFAFIPTNQAEEFFQSVYPTISSGKESKITIFSTPKGMNFFYKMWTEAKEGRSDFVPFRVEWHEIPGRDEEFKRKTIADVGQETWDQEYACEFLGSGGTLIDGATLRTLVHQTPIKVSESVKVYAEPKEGRSYFIGADISRGVGGDYSVAQVIDITELPYRQVAVFRNNRTSYLMMARILADIGRKYNDAAILVETNDVGEAVADSLYAEEEYENTLTTGNAHGKVVLGAWRGGVNGLRTTVKSKSVGCSSLKALVESRKLIINDADTIQELTSFIAKAKSYAADEGTHDDLVMALVIFAWASTQDYFKELNNTNFKSKFIEENTEAMMEELAPFGIFDDGSDEFENGVGWQIINL